MMEDASKSASGDWLTRRERGALWGIVLTFRLATVFGRWPARLLVRGIAAWYVVFDAEVRRSSRQWLDIALPRPVRRADVYRHVLTFAQVTLDRLFFLQGKTQCFRMRYTGSHHLKALQNAHSGAILLGAHLGSFEAMRAGADTDALDIRIVGNFNNAPMINAIFDKLNPDLRAKVIDVGTDAISATLAMRETVENGAMVAILGDRVSADERFVDVRFFGRPARFPAGPFILASVLKRPIYLVFGLYRAPNHYDLYCEPFVERLELPRAQRMQHVRDIAQKYADTLEKYAREAPFCWFNFYDFWGESPQ